MNVQGAQSAYRPAGASNGAGDYPPVLGSQVPGTTGGLPALGGLSVTKNPLAPQLQSSSHPPAQAAQQLRQYGRGEDTMLVHMTPEEVNSLRGLAQRFGGDLTVNPDTGLPEAGWLGRLLPTILGAALAATGVGAPLAAGIVGLGQTALTGNLQKGLMAGLGAFGGASLAGAAGLGGKIAGGNAFGALGSKSGVFGANMGLGAQAANTAGTAGAITVGGAPTAGTAALNNLAAGAAPTAGAGTAGAITVGGVKTAGTAALNNIAAGAAPTAGAGAVAQAAPKFTGGLFSKFGQAAKQGLGTGLAAKAAPYAAGMGLMSGLSSAATPGYKTQDGSIDNSYQGPYTAQRRDPTFAKDTSEILSSSKERDYFPIDIPEIRNMQGQVVQPGSHTKPGTMIYQNVLNPLTKKQRKRGGNMFQSVGAPYMGGVLGEEEEGFAEGGEVELGEGAFVVDARTVSEIGNGSSNAGIELLAKMGGKPVQGPGDGVSDSVPARIGEDQPARVARDEVIFSPEAVRRVGGGDERRGAQKLYALMDKAHKARRKSARGKDTQLRKALA